MDMIEIVAMIKKNFFKDNCFILVLFFKIDERRYIKIKAIRTGKLEKAIEAKPLEAAQKQ